MKKHLKTLVLALAFATVATPVYAGAGTMGFNGGISEGRRVPTTTERILNPSLNGRRSINGTFEYQEMVFLDGRPELFRGELTVSGGAVTAADSGTFNVTHTVSGGVPEDDSDDATIVDRTITFAVNWHRQDDQVVKTYTMSSWAETITTWNGDVFTLVPEQSSFVVSIIEDHNPSAMFYRGHMSKRAVYESEVGDRIIEASGTIYGFDTPFSSTETQNIDKWIVSPGWQMSYQLRPSVSVTSSLQFNDTTPTAISFFGNYMEVMTNRSVLAYDIFVVPQITHAISMQPSGSTNINNRNHFAQLIAPDTTHLRGHFAERDISRLFAQQILVGPTLHFAPSQAMTRGEFITAVVRAIRLEVQATPARTNAFNRQNRIVFPDVLTDRPEYPYIMSAFRSGIAYGRNDGNFHVDVPIPREEVVVTLIRALGLENVAPNPAPITPFVDGMQISDWARREVYAAHSLGLIQGDENGNFRPRELVTKAEAAAFINRFIDYMREDLVRDYSERMVNFIW